MPHDPVNMMFDHPEGDALVAKPAVCDAIS